MGSWDSLDLGSLRVPLTQKILLAPSCLGTSRICGQSADPGRRLARFWSFILDEFRLSVHPEHPQ